MLVKNWMSMFYCRCYTDFVSASLFDHVYWDLNNRTCLSSFIEIVFKF